MIEDHFDMAYELEDTLSRRGKTKELDGLKADMLPAGGASFTRQQAPLGLGHAVWCARDIVGDEPFALLLPDMLHHTAGKGCLAQMIEAYDAHGGNHIAVAPVPDDQTHQYGIVGVEDRAAQVSRITQMVEKPPKGTAPSNLHITGRYILQPSIFGLLAAQEKGAGGEIQLTDSMIRLAEREPFFAVRFDGTSTTPAPRSVSSQPTSPTRWSGKTSAPPCAPRWRGWRRKGERSQLQAQAEQEDVGVVVRARPRRDQPLVGVA